MVPAAAAAVSVPSYLAYVSDTNGGVAGVGWFRDACVAKGPSINKVVISGGVREDGVVPLPVEFVAFERTRRAAS